MSLENELDEILVKMFHDTGVKLTEIGWELAGETQDEAKQAILNLIERERVELKDWIENKATVTNVANIKGIKNGLYIKVDDVLAQLKKGKE